MHRTFRDENSVYFLLEFLEGVELFDAIREIGLMTNEQSRFYIGSMILAIEYLHNLKIIYRDLKPENMMVSINGNLKLIDMGTANILESRNGLFRSTTMIGTPHYMAPEIFEKKGYSFFVDLWSIGVCLFEFMFCCLPYGEDCDDPFDIYQTIIDEPLCFPDNFFVPENRPTVMMIKQLLNRRPEARLGGSYAALKNHVWFANFDWVSIPLFPFHLIFFYF